MKTTLIQFILIGLVALIVGFSANALRSKAALQVSKNYFDTGAGLVELAKQRGASEQDVHGGNGASSAAVADKSQAASDSGSTAIEPAGEPSAALVVDEPSDAPASSGGGHLEHPYQTMTFDEVQALLEDPLTQAGLNVLVDARNEQSFAEGHIPGAMLCNPYQVANYLDQVVGGQTFLDRVLAAEKVIVYCGGGDCADSIFMGRELLALDVPFSSVYLYEGGWKDWTARGGTVEKGMD